MQKLIAFRPKLITQTFFPHLAPKRINAGQCFEWAYLCFLVFDHIELWDMNGHARNGFYDFSHAFVKYRGKFYDAERPHGEKDWRDLPASNFGSGFACANKYNASKFKKEWHEQTERFGTSWADMESLADEMIRFGGVINDS